MQIAGLPLRRALRHPPRMPAARIPDPRQGPRQRRRQQHRQHKPLGYAQNGADRPQHQRARAQLRQVPHDTDGPRQGFGLGQAHLVVPRRRFVVGQINFRRFCLQGPLHVVGNGLGLRFGDDPRTGAQHPTHRHHSADPGQPRQQGARILGLRRLGEEPADGIDDLAGQIERRHRQRSLRHDEEALQNRPWARTGPDQTGRLDQMTPAFARFLHGLLPPAITFASAGGTVNRIARPPRPTTVHANRNGRAKA